ncbi:MULTISPECIES: hypothetical protein [unclassified Sinorhizobium]|uniref:sunset domain-containing protein n=1 Tax=unclassified Sinorhizobium TaxID=2613772 RepID=UPI0024C42A75|nr:MULTISPECIES: hypothetical protein [unclassified Sinorhizobium]MDK1376773.1 hypothetical protein [Sinorhizobium sp. 6-70]MDK1479545.1 hypothetical protein [Sinorhizobium sp. 6-117]
MGKIVDFDPGKHRKRKLKSGAPTFPSHYVRRRSAPRSKGGSIPGILVVGALALFGISQYVSPIPGCDIKGNISYRSGEHIYHVPGKEYYSETRVDFLSGERWFCSEDAAREAGWRKAYR